MEQLERELGRKDKALADAQAQPSAPAASPNQVCAIDKLLISLLVCASRFMTMARHACCMPG